MAERRGVGGTLSGDQIFPGRSGITGDAFVEVLRLPQVPVQAGQVQLRERNHLRVGVVMTDVLLEGYDRILMQPPGAAQVAFVEGRPGLRIKGFFRFAVGAYRDVFGGGDAIDLLDQRLAGFT